MKPWHQSITHYLFNQYFLKFMMLLTYLTYSIFSLRGYENSCLQQCIQQGKGERGSLIGCGSVDGMAGGLKWIWWLNWFSSMYQTWNPSLIPQESGHIQFKQKTKFKYPFINGIIITEASNQWKYLIFDHWIRMIIPLLITH